MVIGGIVVILVGLPASGAMDTPGAISGLWFLAAIGAIVVGILGGRWLLMQAEAHARTRGEPRPPVRLPSWFKWVTLFILIAVGAGAVVAPILVGGQTGETLEFALGGVGFAVGIVGAIWLARRFEEASQHAERAVRLAPNESMFHNNLGVIYRRMRRYEDAVRALRRAIALEDDNPRYHFDLGVAYRGQEDYERAIPAYQAALRLNPNMAPAIYELALMYQATGRDDEAVETFERWLRIAGDREPGTARDVRRRLEALGQ